MRDPSKGDGGFSNHAEKMGGSVGESQLQVATLGVPEPGQLIEARRRQWIVSGVDGGSIAPGVPKKHLVRLASIDEDALGEEIEVLWELEPGAHVIERAGLPRMTGLDDPLTLQAFLDAVVWGAATNADRGYLQAPFRSGVSIEDYQLDPLVRAIDMARTNLLIADDVGLGKTIEAGLVVQEMLLRHRAAQFNNDGAIFNGFGQAADSGDSPAMRVWPTERSRPYGRRR